MKKTKICRRPKRSPCEDFWYMIKLGAVLFGALLVILPPVFVLVR
ncbi:hypothetical protein [Salipiger sp. PrR002]|nr:hypothetical protein [Salipiger sp. PrR002]